MTRTNSIPILLAALAAAVGAPAATAGGPQATGDLSHAYTAIQKAKDAYLAQHDTGRNVSLAHTAIQKAKDAYLAQSGQPGPSFGDPTVASGSAVSSAEGFHWDDAGLGAGITLALVALGGAGLVIRRRMALSPATPTS